MYNVYTYVPVAPFLKLMKTLRKLPELQRCTLHPIDRIAVPLMVLYRVSDPFHLNVRLIIMAFLNSHLRLMFSLSRLLMAVCNLDVSVPGTLRAIFLCSPALVSSI